MFFSSHRMMHIKRASSRSDPFDKQGVEGEAKHVHVALFISICITKEGDKKGLAR